jgi:hypothetical protein
LIAKVSGGCRHLVESRRLDLPVLPRNVELGLYDREDMCHARQPS